MHPSRDPSEAPALLRRGVALLAVGALYSGIVQYAEHAWGGPKPLLVIVLLLGGAGLAVALEPRRPLPVLGSPLLLWAYGYLLLTAVWGVWRPVISADTDQAVVDRFRSVAFLVAMAIAFDDPRARRAGRLAVVAVALLSSAVNVAEAVGVVSFQDALNRTAGRAAGFYVNPNGSGLIIVFGLAAGLVELPRAWRVPALVVATAGLAATFSRGSLACLAVLVVVLLWQRQLPLWLTAAAAGAVALALTLKAEVLRALLDSSGALNADTLARLAMNADDSGRAALANRAWAAFLESPTVGHGIAIEREGRVAHNMYLSLAVEHGLLGLFVYPALLVALCVRNWPALGLAAAGLVAGFTSHNLLEGEPGLLCFALAAARATAAPRTAPAPEPLPALAPEVPPCA
jgi:O-antigen ligase